MLALTLALTLALALSHHLTLLDGLLGLWGRHRAAARVRAECEKGQHDG